MTLASQTPLPQCTSSADVLIVGCGPTGATLALLLEQCGISTLILEREQSMYPLPRAVHFDDHIMRVFQTIGVAKALQQVIRYNPGMRFVDPQNKLLLDWPRPQGISENGWHSSYRFHQPDLEKILRDKISASPLIQLITGAQVTDVQQGHDDAIVHCQLNTKENSECYRGRYVVGCDGANSIVRSSIGQQVVDFGFNEHWLVIDVLLKHDKPELGDFTIQHCGRYRPATYVRCPGHRRRWEIALKPEEQHSTFTHDNLWQLIGDWVSPQEATIERSAVYEFKSQVSKRWRNGRLFIAGDAAHLTPPFMGQGLCAGIRDVANLAWKLALCCNRAQPDIANRESYTNTLLDSYQSERIANVTQYIETAISLGELINTCSTTQQSSNKAGVDNNTVKMKSIVPKLGEGLGAELACEVTGYWFPQPRLSCGDLLDDVVGYKPVLVVRPELWKLCPDNPPIPCAVLNTVSEPELATCLDALNVSAVLLRPDRYILGGATDIEALETLLFLAGNYV